MKQFESIPEIAAQAAEWRAEGKRIGLVPTMGALHAGKEALIRAAAQQTDVAVVSIFVNPLQFGLNENVARYPRRLPEDLAVCEAAGASAAFVPAEGVMLPPGYSTYASEEAVARPLCGATFPTPSSTSGAATRTW